MDQHNLETGVTIGDFRIESRLGAGGMGIVYRARQVSLDRTVALKVLGAALSREADRIRFHREAQAIAKLHHPGITGVHFIGQDRHVCYIAMEFIDGLSLREVIDRLAASRDAALTIDQALCEAQPDQTATKAVRFDEPTADYAAGADRRPNAMPADPDRLTPDAKQILASRPYLRRCSEVAIEAAMALAHAHEHGVVHRDVKPENILLDRQGRVHLIDFGVARFFEDVSLTNTGALIGTSMYMSPEQVTGRLDLDHRTDVYSLGMVLYELLTLARPIAAPTREAILRQIVTKTLPPASWRNPALPRDLEAVLHKAAAKDPDDRYPMAADFAADLRRWLDGKPVTAPLYRYRLDLREIKAERPAGILVLAFAHFLAFAASAVLLISIMLIIRTASYELPIDSGGGPGTRVISSSEVRRNLTTGIPWVALSSAYFLWIGFGLLAANRWARWVSIGGSSLMAGWTFFEIVRDLFQYREQADLAFRVVMIALACSTVAFLLRRSVRDWFRLATRVRAEHRQATEVSPGRDGTRGV